MSSPWTNPELDVMLKDCLERGLSHREAAVKISACFKVDISRNAAISRGGRIGVKSKHKASARARMPASRQKPVQGRAPLVGHKQAPPALRKPPTSPASAIDIPLAARNVPLLDLEPGECRWPTNDPPRGGMHLFCGCPALVKPYCADHEAAAFRSREAA